MKNRMSTFLLPVLTVSFGAAAIMSPLAVYTITLAFFGLPHVLSEFRYVDRRFMGKLRPNLLWRLGGLLSASVVVRSMSVFHLLPSSIALPTELTLVICLALSVAEQTAFQRATAIGIALTIGLAVVLDPFTTAVGFSILHNLTPLGFLWQITPHPQRQKRMIWASLAFIGFPLLVATGLPHQMLTQFPVDPLAAGPLSRHLFVYVPPFLVGSDHSIDIFTASVVAQGAHYFAVIVLLPGLLSKVEPEAKGVIPWPAARWFWMSVALLTTVGVMSFSQGFAETRSLYGIIASIHAWIEIPILILALSGPISLKTRVPM